MLRQRNWRILYEPTTKRRRIKLRKGFTALLVALLTLSLCACAKNDTIETVPDESLNMSENSQAEAENDWETESDFNQYQEDEEVDYNGLIIQRIFIDNPDSENYHATVSLTCLNIDTGASDSVNDFSFDLPKDGADGYIIPYSPRLVGEIANREMFNENYSRMALDKYSAETRLRTAGWMDKNGEFFDVTDYLGLESEYGIGYSAVGFLDDYFVFGEYIHETRLQFYSVPISDMSIENVVQSSNPFTERGLGSGCSWINEDEDWMFYNVGSGTMSERSIDIFAETGIYRYKPENYGCQFGIGNPDGTQFACLACTDEEQHLFEIYIVNMEDLSFAKSVEITDGEEYQFSTWEGHPEISNNTIGLLESDQYSCHLIDWEQFKGEKTT